MSRTEDWNAKLSRLRQMILDEGETWDLSGNDQAAIRFALDLIDSLAEQIGEIANMPQATVIAHHAANVDLSAK